MLGISGRKFGAKVHGCTALSNKKAPQTDHPGQFGAVKSGDLSVCATRRLKFCGIKRCQRPAVKCPSQWSALRAGISGWRRTDALQILDLYKADQTPGFGADIRPVINVKFILAKSAGGKFALHLQ